MSPYASTVGTVATTMTSPLAAWSARIVCSIWLSACGIDDVREVVHRLRERRNVGPRLGTHACTAEHSTGSEDDRRGAERGP